MEEDSHNSIVEYYDRVAKNSYKKWSGATRAIHYGYYESPPCFAKMSKEEIQTAHEQSLFRTSRLVLNLANIGPQDTVLDAGCGTGHLSIMIAEGGAKVAGIGICPDQIKEAQNHCDHLSNATFQLCDFSATKFKDNSFDRAIFLESFCHSSVPEQVLKEMHRVLKPYGRLVFADCLIIRPMTENEQEAARQVTLGYRMHLNGRDCFKKWLLKAGFTCEDFLEITTHTQPSLDLASEAAGHYLIPENESTSHFRGAIALAELSRCGAMGYFLIAANKI